MLALRKKGREKENTLKKEKGKGRIYLSTGS